MGNYEAKKLLILRILDILTDNTDSEHRLKQVEIKRLLELNYGIEIEEIWKQCQAVKLRLFSMLAKVSGF